MTVASIWSRTRALRYFTSFLVLIPPSCLWAPATVAQTFSYQVLAGSTGGPGSSDGTGAEARFNMPSGLAMDAAGNLYIADSGNHTIRRVSSAGVVTTLAGAAGKAGTTDGVGSSARFSWPTGVAVDSSGVVYVADTGNQTIRKISASGAVTTLAGAAGVRGRNDGQGSAARFDSPTGLAVNRFGELYVADTMNHLIRRVSQTGTVVTVAGGCYEWGGCDGSRDDTGSSARFNGPTALTLDRQEDVLVADTANRSIRRVTPGGVVTTVVERRAGLTYPAGIAVDTSGNTYVTDVYDNTLRRVTSTGHLIVAGFAGFNGSADGTGSLARFYNPTGVVADAAGNLYVSDTKNNTIRRIMPSGAVSTLAGLAAGGAGVVDGTGEIARFDGPVAVAVHQNGTAYVADANSSVIRKVTSAGVVTTLAGHQADTSTWWDGVGPSAAFAFPRGIAVDQNDNIYVADRDNHAIRRISPAGAVLTLAGLPEWKGRADGVGLAARFKRPSEVAADGTGNIYAIETDDSPWRVTRLSEGGAVETVSVPNLPDVRSMCGANPYMYFLGRNEEGILTVVRMSSAGATTVFRDNSYSVWHADKIVKAGSAICLLNYGTGEIWIIESAGSASKVAKIPGFSDAAGNEAGSLLVADATRHVIRKVSPSGSTSVLAGLEGTSGSNDGTGPAARFLRPSGIAVDRAGNAYVSDTGNRTIRKITPEGVVTTIAGTPDYFKRWDGAGAAARFNRPFGLAVDAAENVYVADRENNAIRKITAAGAVSTLSAVVRTPGGIVSDTSGNLYVTETDWNRITKVAPDGSSTILAGGGQYGRESGAADGTGKAALFWSPSGIAVDAQGYVYVADTDNNTIRKISPLGVVTTLAGLAGRAGTTDGTGSAARFTNPVGITVDKAGNVYVGDSYNHLIRKITPAGVVSTVGGSMGLSGNANGTGTSARFSYPHGLAIDPLGRLLVADSGNQVIRVGRPAALMSKQSVAVNVAWRSQYSGASGEAIPLPQSDQFGYFYFSDPNNPEVFVKVLDFGASSPYLVFYAGLTDFEYTVTFTNVSTGKVLSFTKPAGSFAGGADNSGLPHGVARAFLWARDGSSADELKGAQTAVFQKEGSARMPELSSNPSTTADDTTLLLSKSRVSVQTNWRSQYNGSSGTAKAIAQKDEFGFFYFSDANNPEVFVKVLDFGETSPYLLFYAGLTDFEYTVTFKNLRTGQDISFKKEAGSFNGGADNRSLPH